MVQQEQRIGHAIKKLDHNEKISGAANYIGDIKFEGMLYAKTLRSTKSRARIIAIDFPVLPDGYFIVDQSDIPGKNSIKMIFDDQPFFAKGFVNYIGEPILLVVGPKKDKIVSILKQIQVHYEEMTPVLSMDEAEIANIAPIYKDKHSFVQYEYNKGSYKEAFESATYFYTGEYQTGYQEQLYIEPQGITAVYDGHHMKIYGSLQCPYYVKNAVVQGLGWEEDRVSVEQSVIGGAFGGKEDYPSLLAGQVAFAALKTGKPVQIILERNEDMIATPKRHPARFRYRTALNDNYQIIGMEVEVLINAGAYLGLSNVVLQRSMFAVPGVYRIPNLYVKGKAMATNTVPNGAFRGFGAPQSFFAIERHMDAIAKEFGLTPLEIRRINMVTQGDSTATGGTFMEPVKLEEMINLIDGMSNYKEKYFQYLKQTGTSRRGIGMSLFLHGCGFTGSGEQDYIKAKAKLRKYPTGDVEILVANVDMGQGLKTTFSKIVAHTLNIPIDRVIYHNPDTSRVPDSGPTVASRSIMVVGGLLEKAAIELKERWDEAPEIEVMKQYRQPEHIRWNDKTFEGDAYPTYSWGVNVVEVEVDMVTLEVTTTGAWGVYDVGTVIDDRIMKGQLDGGLVQALGYASIEVMEEQGGNIRHKSMTDYKVPTFEDVPMIMENRWVENYYEGGPMGAKGAGELPLIGGAPAYAAAVEIAIDVNVNKIPITPEYLLEVIGVGK